MKGYKGEKEKKFNLAFKTYLRGQHYFLAFWRGISWRLWFPLWQMRFAYSCEEE
jgi:hypothetical protein